MWLRGAGLIEVAFPGGARRGGGRGVMAGVFPAAACLWVNSL